MNNKEFEDSNNFNIKINNKNIINNNEKNNEDFALEGNSTIIKESLNKENENNSIIFEKLKKEYNEYQNNLKYICPGNKSIKDNYSKLISLFKDKNDFHFKCPEEQIKSIDILNTKFDINTKEHEMLVLYPDYLHHDMMKDLEYRNSPQEIKNELRTFFIRKFFKLNNILEKIITKYNTINNYNLEKKRPVNYVNTIEEENSSNSITKESNIDIISDFRFSKDKLYKVNSKGYYTNKKYLDHLKIVDYYNNEYLLKYKNFSDFEKFTAYKNYKIFKIKKEIEFTIQRILRLSNNNKDINLLKDFEYYIKKFKLKKLDSVFLKDNQSDCNYNISKDDYMIYIREKSYIDKVRFQLCNLEPRIKYFRFKKGVDIWKSSKILLNNMTMNYFNNKIKDLKNILYEENIQDNYDTKKFKEYFKLKYKFYFNLKEDEDRVSKTYEKDSLKQLHYSYYYDRAYPPVVVTLSSEIRYYLKELCDNFNIDFDITIDNGKVFSYNIDLFYPSYFEHQSKCFTYIPYEFSIRDFDKYSFNYKNRDNTSNIVNIPSCLLRNKYNLIDGFFVNNQLKQQSKINGTNDIKNNNVKQLFIKNSNWVNYVCVFPTVNIEYEIFLKKLNSIGYIDSIIKYEIELIDIVDLNTLNRLIDEYTSNIQSRLSNTVKLNSKYNCNQNKIDFKNLINSVLLSEENKRSNSSKTEFEVNNNDINIEDNHNLLNNYNKEFVSNINSDLLKYFLILRFLKIRDLKFNILNMLNYFRYIQKKFTIDCYKLENKSWKKRSDYDHLNNVFSETNWVNLNNNNNSNEIKEISLNSLLNKESISLHKLTNPLLPNIETILNPDVNYKSNIDQNNYSFILKTLCDEYDEIADFSSEKTVRIKDSRGNYIIYSASVSDMKELDILLTKVATFYINNKESLVISTENTPNPMLDRTQIIMDIYSCELDYLNAKFELISEYMNIYDNITDIFKQKKMMSIIVNLMSQRPEYELENNYFTFTYALQTEELKKKAAFYYTLTEYQKKIEIAENKNQYTILERSLYLYGEIALSIFKYVNISSYEIEIIKKILIYMSYKKIKLLDIDNTTEKDYLENSNKEQFENNKNVVSYEDMITLYDIFSNCNKVDLDNMNQNKSLFDFDANNIKNKDLDINNKNNKSFDNSSISDESSNNNNNIYEIDKKSTNKNKTKEVDPTKDYNEFKTVKKFLRLINFLKRVINKSITGCEDDIESISSSNEMTLIENEFPYIKEIINTSLSFNDKSDNYNCYSSNNFKKNFYNVSNKTNSIDNRYFNNNQKNINFCDVLNYKVRSLLNIPNPFKEGSYFKFIEENKLVLPELIKQVQYSKLEEGFPVNNFSLFNDEISLNYYTYFLNNNSFKVSNDYNNDYIFTVDNPLNSNIEYYESLSVIVDIISITEDSLINTKNMFMHESNLSRLAMNICFYDSLLEEWDIFKEFISGRTKGPNYDRLYYLSDTSLDNSQEIIYTIKSLFNTLSMPVNKIPIQILTKLNKTTLDKLNFNDISANNIYSCINANTLENKDNDNPNNSVMFTNNSNIDIYNNYEDEETMKQDLFNAFDEYINKSCNIGYNKNNNKKSKLNNNPIYLNLNILDNDYFSSLYEPSNSNPTNVKNNQNINVQFNEVFIYSNTLELLRMKKLLTRISSNIVQLREIYDYQKEEILNRQEDMFKLESYEIIKDNKKINSIFEASDAICYNKNYVDTIDSMFYLNEHYSISEIDQSLEQIGNFNCLLSNHISILKPSELKALIYYEYLQYYLLLTAVQTNNVFFHIFTKCFAELDMLYSNSIISFHRDIDLNLIYFSNSTINTNINTSIELSIHQYKSKLKNKLSIIGNEYFYKISFKKLKNKSNIIEKFNLFYQNKVKPLYFNKNDIKSDYKIITNDDNTLFYDNFNNYIRKRILLREYKINLCIAYSKDILYDVLVDCLRLQCFETVNKLQNQVNIIPTEYKIFDKFVDLNDIKTNYNVKKNVFLEDLERYNINNHKLINTHYLKNNNYLFFKNRKQLFDKFYIPNEIEVFLIESQSDEDIVKKYSLHNPFNINEDVTSNNFLQQVNKEFSKVTYNFNKISSNCTKRNRYFRTYIFDQSFEYRSNVLILLKYLNFYNIILNFKLIELYLSQKQSELINLKYATNNNIDFWGDGNIDFKIFKEDELDRRLPTLIVEKMLQSQLNYLNIRHDFVQVKEDMNLITEDLKMYSKCLILKDEDSSVKNCEINNTNKEKTIDNLNNTDDFGKEDNDADLYNDNAKSDFDNKNIVFIFMETIINLEIKSFIVVLNKLKENEILFNCVDKININNTYWLNNIISILGRITYSEEKRCNNLCHISTNNTVKSSNSLYIDNFYMENSQSSFNINKKYLSKYDIMFEQYFSENISKSILSNNSNLINFIFENSLNKRIDSSNNINYYKYSIINNSWVHEKSYNKIPDMMLCINYQIYNDIKSGLYKVLNNTEKYMIYKEINRHNKSLVYINIKKIRFLNALIQIQENKIKYLIIKNNKLICIDNLKSISNFRQDIKNIIEQVYNPCKVDFMFDELIENSAKFLKSSTSTITSNYKNTLVNSKQKSSKIKLALKTITEEAYKENVSPILDEESNNGLELFDREAYKQKIIVENQEKSNDFKNNKKNKINAEITKLNNNNLINDFKNPININFKNDSIESNTIAIRRSTFKQTKIENSSNFRSSNNIINELNKNTINNSDKSNTLVVNALFSKEKDDNLRLENTEIFNEFINSYNSIILTYKSNIQVFLLNISLNCLKQENLAMKEVFANAKSELDISMFKNKHTSALFKEISDHSLVNINKMYYFFDLFLNKLLNNSLEVETHTNSTAYLIIKKDFEAFYSELIRDYILYNSTLKKQEQYTNAVDKFGDTFSIKKLDSYLNAYYNRLNDYEENIEKTTNSKLAINSNKLVFEMDNLYKQLSIYKENVAIMEEYIQTYFQEKFYYITSNLKHEIYEIENKFQVFKEDVKNNTILAIKEEYLNCLQQFKKKTFFLTQQNLKSNYYNNLLAVGTSSHNTNLQNNSNSNIIHYNPPNIKFDVEDDFIEHFYREIDIETNYNKDVMLMKIKNDKLNNMIYQLHMFYRLKMLHIQKNYNFEVDQIKQKLSSNKDLWNKLSIAEKNESILKEELKKTQKNLAADEEFIKKLQLQIRILHDKNVTLEKKLSNITAQEMINPIDNGENSTVNKLYNQTKTNYVYDFKNNVNLTSAINKLKESSNMKKEIDLVLNNLELIHLKYSQELNNKREYISSLNNIKQDIVNIKEINKIKLSEAEFKLNKLKLENTNLNIEIKKLKNSLNVVNNIHKYDYNSIKSYKDNNDSKLSNNNNLISNILKNNGINNLNNSNNNTISSRVITNNKNTIDFKTNVNLNLIDDLHSQVRKIPEKK